MYTGQTESATMELWRKAEPVLNYRTS